MKYYLILLFLFSSCSKSTIHATTEDDKHILYLLTTIARDQYIVNVDYCLMHVDQTAAQDKAQKMGVMRLDEKYRLDLVAALINEELLACLADKYQVNK
jgi:hypothetical protein